MEEHKKWLDKTELFKNESYNLLEQLDISK